MARVCVRPGCDRVARARLTYDPIACQVWLDRVTDHPAGAQEICDLHTDRLTVPRGWMLCDRRGDAPALFVDDTSSVPLTRTDETVDIGPAIAPPVGRPGRRRGAQRVVARNRAADKDGAGGTSARAPELVLFGADPSTPADDGDGSTQAAATDVAASRPAQGGTGSAAGSPAGSPASKLTEPAEAETQAAATYAAESRAPDRRDRDRQDRDRTDNDRPDRDQTDSDRTDSDRPDRDQTDSDRTGPDRTDADRTSPDSRATDVPEVLHATSPLLARAFATSGPQRSVLTQYLDGATEDAEDAGAPDRG